ncbi:MAG: HEAT repeat domain-containing protein, partial [Anaerolineae bacterium]|nr:HEAT repeat domain-containing protein [Anaerolineae bacterium]
MTEYHDNLEDNDFQERPDLDTTLQALKDSENKDTLEAKLFYGLSDLSVEDLEQVRSVWQSLELEHRRKLMQRLIDVAETNVDLDYRTFCLLTFEDRDSEVREAAIEVLWEDESTQVMDKLIEMAQWDESIQVRAAAASALGNFVLMGELGELPSQQT